tara:strand:+ start:172 stop:942 length:771 start_codon:yes stop_codon:yes gene_type:complete
MAVNKNFVVKNGLEVATDVILANATTKKVGIGSTTPEFTLDVRGGIGVTDIQVTGFSTFTQDVQVGSSGSIFYVSNSTNNVGVGTSVPNAAYTLDVRSSVSTGQTALYVYGDMRVTGDLNLDDITLDDASIQNLTVTDTLAVTGLSTFSSNVDINAGLDVAGISSVGAAITMYPSSGIVSATSFYGDGSNLTGIATGLSAAIGVSSEGTFVGSGATIVDFKTTTGTNINNVTVSSGVATVTIQPGVSLGLAIALGG